MLLAECHVNKSRIHGNGLFLSKPVSKGDILYSFVPLLDRRIKLSQASNEQKHFGYVNPLRPDELVICGDISKWWNFSGFTDEPNSVDGDIICFGERTIVAARDIKAGEELLISPLTDNDYSRKLNLI